MADKDTRRMLIDLNCDMGEGMPDDALLMPCISSANIACGGHAGNTETMRATVDLALSHGVSVGAHPGFEDRENFGRLEMKLSETEIYDLVTRQIIALRRICGGAGAIMHHVKPHGALYNMAARDPKLGAVIAQAVADIDPGLILYGLSGSFLIEEAKKRGLRTASEVFADRTYQDDGSLTSRSKPGAMIDEEDKAIAQVLGMVSQGTVTSLSGKTVLLAAETVCLHGDGPHAVPFARRLRAELLERGVTIVSPSAC